MDEKITLDQAITLLREIVSEYGEDYVYEQPGGHCLYMHNGQPSCIVGHVMYRAGVRTFTEGVAARWYQNELTGDAAAMLSSVQAAQDRGLSWGQASAQVTALT